MITATLAEAGQVVAIGQAVARLAHQGEKEAVVALPETWLGEARKAKAAVELWSERGRTFNAHLRELSPQADAATRTYAARFTIEEADDSIAFGMTATVTLSRPSDARVAKLPLSAILNRGTGASVYAVDDGGALVLRPVTVAAFTEFYGVRQLRHPRRRANSHPRRAPARGGPQGPHGRDPLKRGRGSSCSVSICRNGRSRTGRWCCS